MRIGELSRRTGISVRMLRYYEERGLLTPTRAPSGYRCYDEADVDRAALVSSLIRSGLTTKLIIPLLPDGPAPDAADDRGPGPDPELTDLFTAELAKLDAKIACMTLSRDAVRRHLDRLASPVGGA